MPRHMLADYVERRPYDPDGLYYYGQALEELGRISEAREMYERFSRERTIGTPTSRVGMSGSRRRPA